MSEVWANKLPEESVIKFCRLLMATAVPVPSFRLIYSVQVDDDVDDVATLDEHKYNSLLVPVLPLTNIALYELITIPVGLNEVVKSALQVAYDDAFVQVNTFFKS